MRLEFSLATILIPIFFFSPLLIIQAKEVMALERKCERECTDLSDSLALAVCQRKCMSPECYEVLYAADAYELGEIDVRFPHFRGCMAKRLRDARAALRAQREAGFVENDPSGGWDPPPEE
jgi:hypothetical protein